MNLTKTGDYNIFDALALRTAVVALESAFDIKRATNHLQETNEQTHEHQSVREYLRVCMRADRTYDEV